MSDDCGICCSPFTKTTRKMIECNNCHYKACSKCVQHYVLQTHTEVKCMNCNVAWSMNFLFENFSRKFCMDYRHHRREILWNKQLYHLPIISEYLECLKEVDQLQGRLQELLTRITYKKNEYDVLKKKKNKKDMETKEKLTEEIQLLCRDFREIEALVEHSSWRRLQIREDFCGGKVQQVRRGSNRPCITEDCKGFVNQAGECPICNKTLCIDCNVPKVGEEHECKQDDIDTFQEISKNTRPCPKCNIRIHKISGCDQMWCVGCNTAFSWKRGTIETGRIHNPHYFDWLFSGGNERNENLEDNDICNEDQLPHPTNLRNYLNDTPLLQIMKRTEVKNLYMKLQHFISIDLRKYELMEMETKPKEFKYLISFVQGDQKVPKNFESFEMKKNLNAEFYTILNNYKRNQIHLFRALFNKSIAYNDFRQQYYGNKTIYTECISNFNTFFKKKYTINL